MSRNPDAKHGNVDEGQECGGAVLDPPNGLVPVRDDGYAIDDDLHQELDLEDPAKEDKYQERDAGDFIQPLAKDTIGEEAAYVRNRDGVLYEKETDDADDEV